MTDTFDELVELLEDEVKNDFYFEICGESARILLAGIRALQSSSAEPNIYKLSCTERQIDFLQEVLSNLRIADHVSPEQRREIFKLERNVEDHFRAIHGK